MSDLEGDERYEAGWRDACRSTDELVSSLLEDVELYHGAYLRAMRLLAQHGLSTMQAEPRVPAEPGARGGVRP